MKRVILESMELWHRQACPNPDQKALNVQLGCHFEEITEHLGSMVFGDGQHEKARISALAQLQFLAWELKRNAANVEITDRKDFVDSLADVIVTAVGTGYRARMDVPEATIRVDKSNWSKYDEQGAPLFDENGKIKKGPNYQPPNLEGCY